jgi:hypothetical protein
MLSGTGQEQGLVGAGWARSSEQCRAGLVLYIRVLLSACNRREAVGRNTSAASVCRIVRITVLLGTGTPAPVVEQKKKNCHRLFIYANRSCEPERAICWAPMPPRPPYRSTQGAAMSSHGTVRLVVADTTGSIRSKQQADRRAERSRPASRPPGSTRSQSQVVPDYR